MPHCFPVEYSKCPCFTGLSFPYIQFQLGRCSWRIGQRRILVVLIFGCFYSHRPITTSYAYVTCSRALIFSGVGFLMVFHTSVVLLQRKALQVLFLTISGRITPTCSPRLTPIRQCVEQFSRQQHQVFNAWCQMVVSQQSYGTILIGCLIASTQGHTFKGDEGDHREMSVNPLPSSTLSANMVAVWRTLTVPFTKSPITTASFHPFPFLCVFVVQFVVVCVGNQLGISEALRR